MGLFWNATDYNLILDKILDSKYFSSNSKSLLLSMVYKIENYYKDYKVVKKIYKTQDEYLQEIIEAIKKYCDNIKLIEPDSKDAKILKDNNLLAVTNEKERSILSYPTEIALLYAISDVIPKYFYVPDTFALKNAFQQLLVNGYNENNLELLSDFNGWSWDVNLKFKNNIQDSLIYQNFIILFGLEFMDIWMNQTDTKTNQLEFIKKQLSDTKYFDILCKYLKNDLNDKDKNKIDKILEAKRKELEQISDKPKYFDAVKKSKMKYLKEVEKIDKLLNDKDLLRKEYIAKNLKLGEGKRISTLNVYKKMVEKRREVCIDKITYLGKAINPINYINHKRELEEFINNMDSESNNKDDIIIELQVEFIRELKNIILETESVEELKDYIFKIRYYRFLYINNEEQIKNKENLNYLVEDVLKIIIQKLCEAEELNRVCKDEELNAEIIKNILDTKIMDLKEIRFEVNLKDRELQVRTYEREVYEKDFSIPCKYSKKDLLVKLNKPLKLFI